MYKLPLLMLGTGLGYWFYRSKNRGLQIGTTGRYIRPEPPAQMDRQVEQQDYAIGVPGEGAPDAAASNL